MEAFFDQIPRGLRLDSNISAQNAERRRRIRNKRKREKERVGEREGRKRCLVWGCSKGWESDGLRKRTRRWEVFVNRFAGILNIRENNERFLWRSIAFLLFRSHSLALALFLSLSLCYKMTQSEIIHTSHLSPILFENWNICQLRRIIVLAFDIKLSLVCSFTNSAILLASIYFPKASRIYPICFCLMLFFITMLVPSSKLINL